MLSIYQFKTPAAILAVSISLSILTGCGGSSGSNATPISSKLQGIWERQGYGNVIQINENGGNLYQFTRATCLKTEFFDKDDLGELFINPSFSDNDETLQVRHNDSPAFISRYKRLDTLPETCTENRLTTTATPNVVFQHFWHTFNDYYAFFNERDVDWEARYTEFSPLVNDDLDDDELFELLALMLSPIDDGHIELEASDKSYSPEKSFGANRVIEEAFPQQTEFEDIQSFANAMSTQYQSNLTAYLDPERIQSIDGFNSEVAVWGTINNAIGFLQIHGMENFSSVDEGENTQENLLVVHEFMQRMLTDLQDTEAMIIDVRFNPGGEDAISLAIASYFTNQKRQVISKKARYWAGESQIVDAFLTPNNGITYLKPVIVIGGENTASAGEIFLMSMGALPHVTLLGENSSGALSDSLDKALPNGWNISLSNEVYSNASGNTLEVSGVAPDVEAPAFSIESIRAGKNAAIEKSLRILGW